MESLRRLIPRIYSTEYIFIYPLFILILLRSDRDDDMDQDRGKVVYNIYG